MTGIQAIDERRRPRQSNFGALSAGMIVRGAVPSHVLYGDAVAAAAPRPAPAPIATPQPAAPMPLPTIADRPVAGLQRKALTVRLDPVHHMRLRLVGSYLGRSAQDIMIQALNAYLAGLPRSVVEADEAAAEPTL